MLKNRYTTYVTVSLTEHSLTNWISNVTHKYVARTYVFKTSLAVYLGFAREGVERRFLISDIATSNLTLLREQHVARELRVERVWSRFFRNLKIRFKTDVAQLSSQCARSYSILGQKRSGTFVSDPCSGIPYQHFSDGESIASVITPWIW